MALGDLIDFPSGGGGWNLFSFSNQDSHRLINDAILKQNGSVLDEFVLDPLPDGRDRADWLQLHQQMHNNQNAALGLQGYDLSVVDFNDPEDLAAWIAAHYQEHANAHQLLGIT